MAPRPLAVDLCPTQSAVIYGLGSALHADHRHDDAMRVFAEATVAAVSERDRQCAERASGAVVRLLLDDLLFGRVLEADAIVRAAEALSAVTGPRLGSAFRGDWSMALLGHAMLGGGGADHDLRALRAAARIRREAGVARDPAEGLASAALHSAAGLPIPFGTLLLEPVSAALSEYRAWSLRLNAAQELERGDLTAALNASSAAVSMCWSVSDPGRRARMEAVAVRQRSLVLAELGRYPEATEHDALAIVLEAVVQMSAAEIADPSRSDPG